MGRSFLRLALPLAMGFFGPNMATAQFCEVGRGTSNDLWILNNGSADVIYDTWDGQLLLDNEWPTLTSLELKSASGIFTGRAVGLNGPFDVKSPYKVFKYVPSGFSGGDFAVYANPGLDVPFLLSDITMNASLPEGPSEFTVCAYTYSPITPMDDPEHIDWLTQQVRLGVQDRVLSFLLDLNDDAVVDAVDRTLWVHEVAHTYFGDADFDGQFATGDLIEVLQAGEYEDTTELNSTWSEGDWDGDGDFTTGDLIVAFQDGGYEQGPRAATHAVPEPTACMMLILGALMIASGYRK